MKLTVTGSVKHVDGSNGTHSIDMYHLPNIDKEELTSKVEYLRAKVYRITKECGHLQEISSFPLGSLKSITNSATPFPLELSQIENTSHTNNNPSLR